MPAHTTLDKKDWQILEILQRNGRITMTRLGEQVGLSQPAAAERVAKLEASGVIAGYSAEVDLARLGLEVRAIIRLKTNYRNVMECVELLEREPNVVVAHQVSGDDCLSIEIVSRSMADLEGLGRKIAEFGQVAVAIVMKEFAKKPVARAALSAPSPTR